MLRRCERFRLYVLIGRCENKYAKRRAEQRLRDEATDGLRVPRTTKPGRSSEGRWRCGCEAERLAAFKEQHTKCLSTFRALVQSGEVPPHAVLPRRELMAQSRGDARQRAARRLCAAMCVLVLDISRACRKSCVEGVLYCADDEYARDAECGLVVTTEAVDTGPYERCVWQDAQRVDVISAGWVGAVYSALRCAFTEYSTRNKVDLDEGVANVSVTKWGITTSRALSLTYYFGRPNSGDAGLVLQLAQLAPTAADRIEYDAHQLLRYLLKLVDHADFLQEARLSKLQYIARFLWIRWPLYKVSYETLFPASSSPAQDAWRCIPPKGRREAAVALLQFAHLSGLTAMTQKLAAACLCTPPSTHTTKNTLLTPRCVVRLHCWPLNSGSYSTPALPSCRSK
jgi:hypothetical protein